MHCKFYFFIFIILIGHFGIIKADENNSKSQGQLYEDIIKIVQSKKLVEEGDIQSIKFLQIEDLDHYLEKEERKLEDNEIYFPQLNLRKINKIHTDRLSSNVIQSLRKLGKSKDERQSNDQDNQNQSDQDQSQENNNQSHQSQQSNNQEKQSQVEEVPKQKIKEGLKEKLREQIMEKLQPLCYQLKKVKHSHFHKEICILQTDEKTLMGFIFELHFGFLPYSADAVVMTIHQGIATPKPSKEASEHQDNSQEPHDNADNQSQNSQRSKSHQSGHESHQKEESDEEIPFQIENQHIEQKDLEYYNDYPVFKDMFYIMQKQIPILNRFHFAYINKLRQRFYISTSNIDQQIEKKEDKNDHVTIEKMFKSKKRLHYRIFDAKIHNRDTKVETDEIVIMISNHSKGFKNFDEVKNESLVKNKLEEIIEKLKEVHNTKVLLQLIQTVNR